MANLPLLKSGQVAQYPLRRTVKSIVDTVQFLDGSEQRSAVGHPLHEWTLQLGLIDDEEFSALQAFVELQQGQTGTFTFVDPADGNQYANCSLALGVLTETVRNQGRVMTTLIVRENPN